MKRNRLIIVLLLVVFLFFSFRVGWKLMGLNIDFETLKIGGSKGIDAPSGPGPQALNKTPDAGTGPTKVGSVTINPGSVTRIGIER